jgi:hypothetical protein
MAAVYSEEGAYREINPRAPASTASMIRSCGGSSGVTARMRTWGWLPAACRTRSMPETGQHQVDHQHFRLQFLHLCKGRILVMGHAHNLDALNLANARRQGPHLVGIGIHD